MWFDSTFSKIVFDFRILLEAWDDCLNLGIFVLAAAVAVVVIFDTSINGSSFLNKNRTPSASTEYRRSTITPCETRYAQRMANILMIFGFFDFSSASSSSSSYWSFFLMEGILSILT